MKKNKQKILRERGEKAINVIIFSYFSFSRATSVSYVYIAEIANQNRVFTGSDSLCTFVHNVCILYTSEEK